MFVIALFSFVILGACVALMSIGIVLKKGGTFPSAHVSDNTMLKNKGIHCAMTQDRIEVKKKNIFDYIEINNTNK